MGVLKDFEKGGVARGFCEGKLEYSERVRGYQRIPRG